MRCEFGVNWIPGNQDPRKDKFPTEFSLTPPKALWYRDIQLGTGSHSVDTISQLRSQYQDDPLHSLGLSLVARLYRSEKRPTVDSPMLPK